MIVFNLSIALVVSTIMIVIVVDVKFLLSNTEQIRFQKLSSPRMCDADVTSAKRLASVVNSSIVRDAIVLVNLDSFFDSTTAMTKSPKYL